MQANEHQLQNRQTENAARAKSLPHEIQATQQTLENLQTDAQQFRYQDAQNLGILTRLIRPLTRKPARLNRKIQATQQTLENLQEELRQLPDKQTENSTELERLKSEIEKVDQEIEEEEGEIKKFRDELRNAKSDVVEKASEVNKEASKEIIGQAWKLELVPDFLKERFGGVSTGYGSVLFANLSYNLCLYCYFGINIFDYSQIQDFAVPGFRTLVISLNIIIWILLLYFFLGCLRSYKFPVFVEMLARVLSYITKSLKREKVLLLLPLFVLSFIIVPGAIAWWDAESISTSKDKVKVITVPELKTVAGLIRVGSSSTYEFFLKNEDNKDNKKEHTTIAIPLSGIVGSASI